MMATDYDATHQYLASAGEGGDMEGHIGEDEERVRVLRQLLQPGDVVRTSEREVHQQAGEEIWFCPTHIQFIFRFISLHPFYIWMYTNLQFTFGFVQLILYFRLKHWFQSHLNTLACKRLS